MISGKDSAINVGNSLPLKNIPVGTQVHCIEMKPEKKSTKLTKAKAVKTAKAKSGSETSETLGKQEKISEMDDKSTMREKDEKKKTRRRGWWSKDG